MVDMFWKSQVTYEQKLVPGHVPPGFRNKSTQSSDIILESRALQNSITEIYWAFQITHNVIVKGLPVPFYSIFIANALLRF